MIKHRVSMHFRSPLNVWLCPGNVKSFSGTDKINVNSYKDRLNPYISAYHIDMLQGFTLTQNESHIDPLSGW